MTDYKLVPVGPTIEMLAELGFNGDYELAVGHADICADLEDRYRAMIGAAPDVQGEPVFMWHKGATEDESEVVDVDCACPCCVPLYATPQPAERPPAAKFKHGDLVRKIKGIQWNGRVVGTYSTELTPEGYAVESDTEKGSVQIYPAAALELAGGDA